MHKLSYRIFYVTFVTSYNNLGQKKYSTHTILNHAIM